VDVVEAAFEDKLEREVATSSWATKSIRIDPPPTFYVAVPNFLEEHCVEVVEALSEDMGKITVTTAAIRLLRIRRSSICPVAVSIALQEHFPEVAETRLKDQEQDRLALLISHTPMLSSILPEIHNK
jgi:hypothetical protein